jgi:hypothetical protein
MQGPRGVAMGVGRRAAIAISARLEARAVRRRAVVIALM